MPPLHGGVVVSCRSPNLRFRRLAFRHRIECAAKNSDATAIRPCENWYRVLAAAATTTSAATLPTRFVMSHHMTARRVAAETQHAACNEISGWQA